MSGLIPDLEYAIFISCDNKDNNHVGWVTKSVVVLLFNLKQT